RTPHYLSLGPAAALGGAAAPQCPAPGLGAGAGADRRLAAQPPELVRRPGPAALASLPAVRLSLVLPALRPDALRPRPARLSAPAAGCLAAGPGRAGATALPGAGLAAERAGLRLP